MFVSAPECQDIETALYDGTYVMIVQYMVAEEVNPDPYYQIWGAIWVKIKLFLVLFIYLQ